MTLHDDNWRRAHQLLGELATTRGTGHRANLLFEALQVSAAYARQEERRALAERLSALGRPKIAAALQKLMDERDEQMEWAKSTYAEMRQRAEAAEKRLEIEREGYRDATEARQAAEARLAECVREVRAYNTVMDGSREPWWPDLMDILDKYSPSATPPSPAAADRPEHPDKGAK